MHKISSVVANFVNALFFSIFVFRFIIIFIRLLTSETLKPLHNLSSKNTYPFFLIQVNKNFEYLLKNIFFSKKKKKNF